MLNMSVIASSSFCCAACIYSSRDLRVRRLSKRAAWRSSSCVRRAAFSSHKWQVKSSQVKRRIFVTVNKLGRQHRHVPSSYPLHYNTHYRTVALAARSVTETLNNLSMAHSEQPRLALSSSRSMHGTRSLGSLALPTAPTSFLISARGTEHLHARTYTPSPWHARLARARGTAPLPAPPHRPMHK